MQQGYDIVIVGAGAAGLMCALTAGRRGRSVLLLDHADKAGSKILISGGGRCNFTNLQTTAGNFISANPHFCKAALARFTPDDFIAMLERYDIAWHEREHGQLFCNHSARDILDMLLAECAEGGVETVTGTQVQHIDRQTSTQSPFRLATSRGTFDCASLVIASGGLSIPKIGATGFGLKVAEQFGLAVCTPQPGLVPFTFTGPEKDSLRELAGIALDVRVSCHHAQFREAMLFTHRGLSGPAMLQISSYWQPGDTLVIDLLPDRDVASFLQAQRRSNPQMMLTTALTQVLPRRLVRHLEGSLFRNERLQEISDKAIVRIDDALHGWHLKPNGTEGYRTAEVTVGGVDTRELSSKTMESRKVPGLYFIGEVVDVTGQLGGFNFQWAWSSGYAAGLVA